MIILYQIAKSLHFVGLVSWMAGLFYLVRIMVYHAEALKMPSEKRQVLSQQYQLMEWRAYKIITAPALVITWSFGTMMLFLQPQWFAQPWMHGKLFFLVLLTGYTHYCKGHIRLLEKGSGAPNHLFYRGLNEVPTILMIAIIFLAVLKNNINWWFLAGGVSAFAALIFYAVRKSAKRLAQ